MKKFLGILKSVVTHPFFAAFAGIVAGMSISVNVCPEGALRLLGLLGLPVGVGIWFLIRKIVTNK